MHRARRRRRCVAHAVLDSARSHPRAKSRSGQPDRVGKIFSPREPGIHSLSPFARSHVAQRPRDSRLARPMLKGDVEWM